MADVISFTSRVAIPDNDNPTDAEVSLPPAEPAIQQHINETTTFLNTNANRLKHFIGIAILDDGGYTLVGSPLGANDFALALKLMDLSFTSYIIAMAGAPSVQR